MVGWVQARCSKDELEGEESEQDVDGNGRVSRPPQLGMRETGEQNMLNRRVVWLLVNRATVQLGGGGGGFMKARFMVAVGFQDDGRGPLPP